MTSLRVEMQPVFNLLRNGRTSSALERLESLRAAADAADAGERATYFQALAGALDVLGRTEEALAAAERALAIDRELWPEGRGTWLTLHSMVIILERIGRRDEAAARAAELLAVGEKLGGLELAAAAAKRAAYLSPAEQRVVLERGRFACQVAWRDRTEQTDRYELALSWAEVAMRLASTYGTLGDLDRAELPLLEVMPHTAASKTPALRRKFAAIWSHLANIANRRERREEARYFYRCTLANVDDERDRQSVLAALDLLGGRDLPSDPSLDALRAVRVTEGTVLLADPARGCFSYARELASPDIGPFDAVEMKVEAGRVRSIARADRR